jgi:hypothetical protein
MAVVHHRLHGNNREATTVLPGNGNIIQYRQQVNLHDLARVGVLKV